MSTAEDFWASERRELLGKRISELGLRIEGSPIEALVRQLHEELDARGLRFHPPVYLSDQWGCPSDVPIIGVPFYLADRRLARLEEEFAVEVEGERDAMKFMRHEAGHAFNYAYRLYELPEWRKLFGPYSRPYRERFRVDPFSRAYVRHILGWYAQKHPDEDFAETFAVWLTPGLDWRREYAGWPALRKLEYVDGVMRDLRGREAPALPEPRPEYLPVEAMQYTVGEHYGANGANGADGADGATGAIGADKADHELRSFPETLFDADLSNLFSPATNAPAAPPAATFLRSHRREVVTRIAYWTGEPTAVVRDLVDTLTRRAEELDLRAAGLEAALLIELTAFLTAVVMNFRYSDSGDIATAGAA